MKLFRRKAEFYDIFAGPVSLASLPGLNWLSTMSRL